MILDVIATQVIGDIALVIAVSAVLGAVARRCGQPTVVGQILTGVLLGPTVLGKFPGHPVSHLFPHQAVPYITVLAQVAVVIFMFTVGYEIEFAALCGHGRAVPLVGISALFTPMLLGIGGVLAFRSRFAALDGKPESRSFVLFMGVALAITALPVMAAIVRERGIAGTTAGVIAMAAAGVMDVAAWLILAAVLIGAGHTVNFRWPVAMLLTGCLVAVMLLVVRPVLGWWLDRRQFVLSSPVPVAFTLAMSCAWITSSLGLHPVFGAFLAGLAMRGNRAPDPEVLRSMEQAGGLLLPLFFAVTGLSLDAGAIRGNGLVLLIVILVISCAGKLGPAYGVSRASRLEPRQAATVAVLVNTRGLTELIALNVGLADGIIGPQVFTVLVLMAVLTTLMTGPLLTALNSQDIRLSSRRHPQVEGAARSSEKS